jgi:hypothetical protein
VQRVVIACDTATGLSQAEREALCKQLVKKADVLTDLPVSLASAADLDPTNLSHQADQLLLRVAASASPVAAGRKTVTLTVTPVRAAVAVAPMPGLTSSLLKVQGDWVLQGPIDAFTKLLGSGPQRLHRPVRSDM